MVYNAECAEVCAVTELLENSVGQWNKRGALEEIENLKSIRATAWDEHTHSFRWLMASLLGVNGAACLGIIGVSEIPLEHRMYSGGAFVFGILSALLVAVFGQRSVQQSLLPLQRMIGYWMTVVDDGIRDEGMEQGLNDELKDSAKFGHAGRVFGWLSALAFAVGAMAAGNGMLEHTNVAKVSVSSNPALRSKQ
jgi:hypothetical protein